MFIYLRAWLPFITLIIPFKNSTFEKKNNRLNTATPTILAFYLLMLAFVPCADAARACVAESPARSIEWSPLAADTHDHHSEENDHCSPLCICSCCGSFVLLGLKLLPPRQQLTIIEEVPLLPDQSCEYFYLSCVFRPPIRA